MISAWWLLVIIPLAIFFTGAAIAALIWLALCAAVARGLNW